MNLFSVTKTESFNDLICPVSMEFISTKHNRHQASSINKSLNYYIHLNPVSLMMIS